MKKINVDESMIKKINAVISACRERYVVYIHGIDAFEVEEEDFKKGREQEQRVLIIGLSREHEGCNERLYRFDCDELVKASESELVNRFLTMLNIRMFPEVDNGDGDFVI